ncbi:uncharacterized protein LOC111889615 [Lactuca sativa]|uniref:DNA N(6)-methyladenine demethylase n=1 Tax=Lactuca sativa TaxID=4236 RepID=A0A9R1XT75_LACSA|nr:uncharacterized protein LOC111889615 [Lactuca sativa]KAJ0224916.1 hypothetical protein LSAT_V11C100019730 [Lactuca sativa]
MSSGRSRGRGNQFPAGKSAGRWKQTNAGPPFEWKPKTKVALDESCVGASSCQKDDSSLSAEYTSEKMCNSVPKPDLTPQLQEESSSHPVKNPSSGIESENVKPIPDSSQKADNVSTEPKSVSTFDSNSKNSNHTYPIPLKSQKGMESQDGIAEKGKQTGDKGGKPEDTITNHVSSITRFDICPKKVKTGAVKLKPSLHSTNKEKRNQSKREAEGPKINILRSGMVLLKGYISSDDQVNIVKTCRDLGIREGGFYQPGYQDGAKLHLKMMCLGRNWDPQSSGYIDTRPIDNSKPPEIPEFFHDMVKRALQDSNAHIQKNKGKIIPFMLPDICIVNFYTKTGKLGLHQDKDESRESLNEGLPVVSFSVGETAEFLYGNDRDVEKAERVNLESGDVLIFGGESRHVFHGVPCIFPDTAPKSLLEATNMLPGRLNLTFRKY